MINTGDIDFNNISFNKKSCIDILFITLYTKFDSLKPLRVIINKIRGCIENCDGSKYLTLISIDGKAERIFDKIKYLKKLKKIIQMIMMKIKTNSQDDSHLVEKLKNHDVMMLLRSNFFYFNKYNPQMFF